MKGKQFVIGFILGALLFGSVSTLAATKIIEAEYNDIKIQVNGKEVKTDVEPFVMDGRTMVPVRFIAEELGKEVNFDQDTSTVKINDKAVQQSGNETSTEITNGLGEKSYIKSGIEVTLIDGVEYVLPDFLQHLYPNNIFLIPTDNINSPKLEIVNGNNEKKIIDSVPFKRINGYLRLEYSYVRDSILPLIK